MRRYILIIILSGLTLAGFAQNEWKYTASTQMFLSEQLGETDLPKINERRFNTQSMVPQISINSDEIEKFKRLGNRRIAEAEMVNGVKMISAFIGFSDNNFEGVKALGVDIQSEFDKLVVALIPVNQIEAVAALANVTRIEVAEVLQPANDTQRTVTQAGDAISNSAAAQALGLTKQYTGKNVILGIIDSGVDFTHIAFKDKNGNTRIKRAYKLSANSTSLTTYSSASQIAGLTYDTNDGDHGTHTSTTAGGSSVIVNGSTVTVTDDHANATYGGMAPEADLVIAGLSSLYTTAIGSAIQNICNYADQQGKPCVISLSLGSQSGPHDGTGSVASIVNQYAGNNHIIVYAASNDAMRADYFVQAGTSNGGGCYASGTSTNSKTLLVNLQKAWTNADGNVQLYNPTFYACARNANTAISLKFRVVDTTNGSVVYSTSAYTGNSTISMTESTGLAQYFYTTNNYANNYGDVGIIRIIRGQDNNSGKYYFQVYCPLLVSRSFDDADGDGVYNSKYALCVSVYPTNGSTIIDMWESSQVSWFGNDLKLSSTYANSYNVVQGNDECSVSDNACYPNVISVGAYVTRNQWTASDGTPYTASEDYPNIGDHASFSSWQTAGYGPLGTPLPTINAPGARIVAGVNHYHTASVDDYSYYGDNYKSDLIVNSSTSPYALMEGTSMATPCVSGIVAQWLEACVEKGITPTPAYIKEVMENTWDTDEWTNGTGSGAHGAKTFGTHGKINAIKGIQYILGVTGGPSITAQPTAVQFSSTIVSQTATKTVTVTGNKLKGNVTAALSGTNAVMFSIDKTSIAKATAEAGTSITITYAPTAAGNHTAALTLSSTDATDVVINITGKGEVPVLIADPETLTFEEIEAGKTTTKTFGLLADNLTDQVTATISGDNASVFSLSKSTFTIAEAEDGQEVTVTYSPQSEGTHSATVTLSSQGAEPVTVTLNGTATRALPDFTEVTIGSYGLTTLYYDYPIVIPYDNDDILGVYYVYALGESDVKLARLHQHIPANTGVIVQGNSGTYQFPTYRGSADEIETLKGRTNYLKGSLTDISPADAKAAAGASADAQVLTLGKGSNGYVGFYNFTGNKLSAHKTFLIYEPAGGNSNVSMFSIGGLVGDTFTGIHELESVGANDGWYTVQGQKLVSAPKQRGIYIRNGKTVVVK